MPSFTRKVMQQLGVGEVSSLLLGCCASWAVLLHLHGIVRMRVGGGECASGAKLIHQFSCQPRRFHVPALTLPTHHLQFAGASADGRSRAGGAQPRGAAARRPPHRRGRAHAAVPVRSVQCYAVLHMCTPATCAVLWLLRCPAVSAALCCAVLQALPWPSLPTLIIPAACRHLPVLQEDHR